jgi:hypothetical protein
MALAPHHMQTSQIHISVQIIIYGWVPVEVEVKLLPSHEYFLNVNIY